MARSLLNKTYRRVRGVDVDIDAGLSGVDLAAFVWRRLAQRARGALRLRANLYAGSRVKIRSAHKFSTGANCVLGDGVTIDALSKKGVRFGDAVTVDQMAVLRGSGVIRNLGVGISVGSRTSIGAFNVILGQGGIEIGNDCLLGPNVTLVSENHIYDDPALPVRLQGEARSGVRLGNDVWLGAGVTILAGARVGDGCVVAAGAVVRGEVAPYTVVGGVPARELGRRT